MKIDIRNKDTERLIEDIADQTGATEDYVVERIVAEAGWIIDFDVKAQEDRANRIRDNAKGASADGDLNCEADYLASILTADIDQKCSLVRLIKGEF